MNPASEVWTGWARADALGRSLGELIRLVKPNGGGTTEVPAALMLDDGVLREMEAGAMLVTKDGAKRSVGGTVAPIRDHVGRVAGGACGWGPGPRPLAGARSLDWADIRWPTRRPIPERGSRKKQRPCVGSGS